MPLFPPDSPARRALAALALCGLAWAGPAAAQSAMQPPRFGAGFEVFGALPGQTILPEGVAVGARLRAALPVNADLSVAADLGVGALLWEGAAEARYVLNPQTSLIVTLPGRGPNVRYVLAGVGGFLPLSGGGGGTSLHLGVGTAVPLSATSIFFEFDPSLVVGQDETTGVHMARAGVIF